MFSAICAVGQREILSPDDPASHLGRTSRVLYKWLFAEKGGRTGRRRSKYLVQASAWMHFWKYDCPALAGHFFFLGSLPFAPIQPQPTFRRLQLPIS
jgi:hypothetical protein